MIISAENKAFPILAYSKKNNFDRSKLSEEENKMLQRYAREIEIVRYDSRVPERAVTAWQNLQGYISDVLQNPYSTPEYQSLGEDEKERLEEMDRLGSQILLPKAVEFALYDPDDFREYTLDDAIAEEDSVYEVPFKFYDDFVKTVKAEELAREISFEEVLNPSKPVVKNLGGAHYEIDIPQYAKMARIYAMDGSRQIEKYYADTRVVNLDLSALNNGFYVCMILTEDGKIYGLKLSR